LYWAAHKSTGSHFHNVAVRLALDFGSAAGGASILSSKMSRSAERWARASELEMRHLRGAFLQKFQVLNLQGKFGVWRREGIPRSSFTASIRTLASMAISRRAVAKTSAIGGANDRDDGAC